MSWPWRESGWGRCRRTRAARSPPADARCLCAHTGQVQLRPAAMLGTCPDLEQTAQPGAAQEPDPLQVQDQVRRHGGELLTDPRASSAAVSTPTSPATATTQTPATGWVTLHPSSSPGPRRGGMLYCGLSPPAPRSGWSAGRSASPRFSRSVGGGVRGQDGRRWREVVIGPAAGTGIRDGGCGVWAPAVGRLRGAGPAVAASVQLGQRLSQQRLTLGVGASLPYAVEVGLDQRQGRRLGRVDVVGARDQAARRPPQFGAPRRRRRPRLLLRGFPGTSGRAATRPARSPPTRAARIAECSDINY